MARHRLCLSLFLLAGCADNVNDICPVPPCVAPIAVEIVVRSAVTQASLPGAFVVAGSPTQRQDCTGGTGATCVIVGGPGTYAFDVGAAGYQTVSRSVLVVGSTPRCGCPIVTTQKLDVPLAPTL